MNIPRNARGFTLVEVLITIAVAAVLMAIAVPSFEATIARTRLSSASSDLQTALAYARSEAVRQGTRVVVCGSNDTTAATPTCSGSNTWSNGWIVFTDTNGNRTSDAGEARLRVFRQDGVVTMTSQSALASGVSFQSNGFAEGIGSGSARVDLSTASAANREMRLCHNGRHLQRTITVSMTGQVTIAEATC